MPRHATGDRAPGALPLLLPRIDALAAREGSSKAVLAPVVAELRIWARDMDGWVKREWDGYLSLPALHNQTHMGGKDTVETTLLPTPITLGDPGAVGDPSQGYSPGAHAHPTDGLDFLIPLADLAVDGEDGIAVSDVRARRLLEAILFELELLSRALGDPR